jgi:hypothetical protein
MEGGFSWRDRLRVSLEKIGRTVQDCNMGRQCKWMAFRCRRGDPEPSVPLHAGRRGAMDQAHGSRPGFSRPVEQAEPDQQHGADADGRIGQVEGRVGPVSEVDQDEIGHLPARNAIDQVAQGTADDQRQRQRGTPVATRRARQPDQQHGADHQRQNREKPALPAAAVGQKTEGRTTVVGQRPIEKSGNDRDPLPRDDARAHPPLAELIQHDDCGRQPQPVQRVGFGKLAHTGLCFEATLPGRGRQEGPGQCMPRHGGLATQALAPSRSSPAPQEDAYSMLIRTTGDARHHSRHC